LFEGVGDVGDELILIYFGNRKVCKSKIDIKNVFKKINIT